MEYCKYHPLEAATYHCPHCDLDCCDQCVDIERNQDTRCFHCQQSLESLGSSNSATPFWRRLPESFRYPLNSETAVLVVVVSFLTSVLGYVPLGFLWVLMISGAFFKYSMSCLEKTAQGEMTAPDITSAYGGGLSLLFQLLLILAVMGAAVIAAYVYLGSAIGGLLGTFMVIALPAVLINFAISESVVQALNPSDAVRIIKTVGLPYGILMAFILIMTSSVGVIGSLLGDEPSVWLSTAQSIVSNYYTLVIFHIMGYMIFQYQKEFGFYARHSDVANLTIPSERERLTAKIDVTLKEARFSEVLELYSKGLKKYPNDSELFASAFSFMSGIKDREHIGNLTDRYIQHLKSINRLDKIRAVYSRTRLIDSDYVPGSALARHLVAKSCFDCGDFNQAAKLLNGLHRQHPDYFDLANAYLLMADALTQLPKMADNAKKYRLLAEKIKQQPKAKKTSSPDKSAATAQPKVAAQPAATAAAASTQTDQDPAATSEKTQAQINAERRAQARQQAAVRKQEEQSQSLSLAPVDENKPVQVNEHQPVADKTAKTSPTRKEEPLQAVFAARAKPVKDDDVFDFSEEDTSEEEQDKELPPIEFR